MMKVTAIFDIGKTNKKLLLFNEKLELVSQTEEIFPTIVDEDGFECDDIFQIENWILYSLETLIRKQRYELTAVNFTTYGASLAYIDEDGRLLTPVYNYLKPMPDGIVEPFYTQYGGESEFSRVTSSPALGMLNSGLQALWLKNGKPDVFEKVKHVLHFPQYLSYVLSGEIASEHTSIGCHTAMWNFDSQAYHKWITDEKIPVPQPLPVSAFYPVTIAGKSVNVGIGIHDSSASLAPYLLGSKEKFILISTGTWCISMNPFNCEPLTAQQLQKDCLCYMSILGKPVKSSRLFMGHIHEANVKRLSAFFFVPDDSFKRVAPEESLLKKIIAKPNSERLFFKNGLPDKYVDRSVDLGQFESFEVAYHYFMRDLTLLNLDAIELVTEKIDTTESIYISGGFARNEIYVRLMATFFPDKNVYTSVIDNASAIGAAMVVNEARKNDSAYHGLVLMKWEAIKC